MMRFISILAIIAALPVAAPAAAADFTVIVNRANTSAIDKAMIAKIFLGEKKSWEDGTPVAAIDLAEDSPTRAHFSSDVLGEPVGSVKALWAQMIFSGKALPPKKAASDDEVKKFVGANKGGIGYIMTSSVDESVKVAMGAPAPTGSPTGSGLYVVCSAGLAVTAADVRGVFLGEKAFVAGAKVAPADNSTLMSVFLAKVLKTDATTYTALWAKKSMRDGTSAPEVKSSDNEILEYIKHTPFACGYISSAPPAGVNVAGTF
jgi:ABC-type phosphate transport system substrate-binding protein